jgi:phosphatidylinositol-bisphosphatase
MRWPEGTKVNFRLRRTGNELIKIRLKLGTFNVNGVLPSQDLSSWLGRSHSTSSNSDETSFLPPLPSISPLTLNDEPKTLSQGSLADDDADADLIVLGFQELDLSTEALLYSTKTAREDAWCTAIFAALGEKAEMYEKVLIPNRPP